MANRGQFKQGQSGNPKGKPKGARHKATIAALTLLDGEAEALTRKAVEMALGGDTTALRLCLERISPAPKSRAVSLDLPALDDARSITRALAAVVSAVAAGTVTPSEGKALSDLLEAHRRAVETEELEHRIIALEKRR